MNGSLQGGLLAEYDEHYTNPAFATPHDTLAGIDFEGVALTAKLVAQTLLLLATRDDDNIIVSSFPKCCPFPESQDSIYNLWDGDNLKCTVMILILEHAPVSIGIVCLLQADGNHFQLISASDAQSTRGLPLSEVCAFCRCTPLLSGAAGRPVRYRRKSQGLHALSGW